MANGIIFGKVLAVRDYSVLLDDGNFYGARDMVDQLEDNDISLKDTVLLSYWTKAVKNEETEKWINFRNVRKLVKIEDADFPRLAAYFDTVFDHADEGFPVKEDVPAPHYDDDVPF